MNRLPRIQPRHPRLRRWRPGRHAGNRVMTCVVLFLLFVLSGPLVSISATAQHYAALKDARWQPTQSPHTDVADDRRTATTRVPPRNALFQDISVQADLHFHPGKLHPGTSATVLSPASARDHVYCVYPGDRVLTCHARKKWLRSLTRPVHIRLRIDGTGDSHAGLDWVLQPAR